MSNSRAKAAQGAASTAAGTATGYGSGASSIGSTLVPELTKEATNPTGFNPTDLNSMLVAGQQGAGGANAGITGQANLEAARTHNTGGLSAVLGEAARAKTRANSESALGVQGANAQLKEKQRQSGISGLEGMYGTDVGAQLKAQGLVPEDIDAWTKASQTGPLQDVEGIIGTLAGAATGAGSLMRGMNGR